MADSKPELISSGSDGQSFLAHAMQDNPLTLGLIALVIGALIGLLIPETRKENELMGKTRDQLAERAQVKMKETAKKVGTVAATAQHAAQEALGKSEDAIRESVTEAIDSIKDEAKEQGLPVGA